MAWTTPRNWATNDVVTAALMNVQLRDNLNFLFAAIVPSGAISPFAGSSAPTNWLICDGSAVSRTTYATLFTAIGTTYGAGDGSTTFNVPDLRGRFPLGKDNMGGTSANRVLATQADNLGQGAGEENHTLTIAEMPTHNHAIGNPTTTAGGNTDAFTGNQSAHNVTDQGGGGAHNTMPPYMTLNYIIKT